MSEVLCIRKLWASSLKSIESTWGGTSLVAQWLRIRLPMQGTRVRSLVREDPTCRGAAKPMCNNYWACALEPVSHNCWAHVPQLLKPARLEPMLHNKRSHCTATKSSPRLLQLEKVRAQQRRSNTAHSPHPKKKKKSMRGRLGLVGLIRLTLGFNCRPRNYRWTPSLDEWNLPDMLCIVIYDLFVAPARLLASWGQLVLCFWEQL